MKLSKFNFDSCIKLNDDMIKKIIQIKKYERFLWFVEVLTLKEGHSFGELALINNKPRAATITTTANCMFAVLGRNEYQKILQKIENKQIEQRIMFFKQMPPLQHWTKKQIQRLMQVAQLLKHCLIKEEATYLLF